MASDAAPVLRYKLHPSKRARAMHAFAGAVAMKREPTHLPPRPERRSAETRDEEAAELDPVVCYRALQTRDARFDGRFYIAVVTTRIFCRPICPAPPAKLENCIFLPSAAAAHQMGFRPCLR